MFGPRLWNTESKWVGVPIHPSKLSGFSYVDVGSNLPGPPHGTMLRLQISSSYLHLTDLYTDTAFAPQKVAPLDGFAISVNQTAPIKEPSIITNDASRTLDLWIGPGGLWSSTLAVAIAGCLIYHAWRRARNTNTRRIPVHMQADPRRKTNRMRGSVVR